MLFNVLCSKRRYGIPFVHFSVPKSKHFVEHVIPQLDDNRFKVLFRVSRNTFAKILTLICDDVAFLPKLGRPQLPLELQLMIVLYRLGTYGEGYLRTASLFGVGDGGTITNVMKRVFLAILKLKGKYIFWPDFNERHAIANETLSEMPQCIGYVDGTEIRIAEKPVVYSDSFLSRKQIYSLKVQVTCDYHLKIRHLVLGYPGSVHDARIYNNCPLALKPELYFSEGQYLLGDSAYKLTNTVMTPFRINTTDPSSTLIQSNYNRTLGRYRVRVENCIGLLKEIFCSLKELKMSIKNNASIKDACDWILVCGILLNIILEDKDDKEIGSFETPEEDISDEVSDLFTGSNNANTVAEIKRRRLMQMLYDGLN